MAIPTGPLTIDVLSKLYDQLRLNLPVYDSLTVGHRTFYDIQKNDMVHRSIPYRSLYGMDLIVNPMFPYTQTCSECGGTGEGKESTYCPKCKGAGAERIEGIMTGRRDSMVLLTSPLPKKPVQWPRDVLVPLRKI